MEYILLALVGVPVGVGAAFTGLGGGFLVVPLLLVLGYSSDVFKKVFAGILVIPAVKVAAS